MSYSESLVGTIAILVAVISVAVSIGPWSSPYELRTFAAIRQRFGMRIARVAWVAIAVASLTSGLAILNGVRPSYADPGERSEIAH